MAANNGMRGTNGTTAPRLDDSAAPRHGDSAAPRRGLVLGAGGVLGAAWTVGALRAVELATGWDPRTAEVVVGTSAGSVLSAFVGLGVSTEQMANHQRGVFVPGAPMVEYDYDGQAPLPPRPRFGRLGSRQLLVQTARHPRRVPPLAAIASVLPPGRGSIRAVGDMVERVRHETVALGLRNVRDADWPVAPTPWIVTMDYDTGKRVVFGRSGSPDAELADAVTASCSIPGWYEPVLINGRRYIDGGTCSATSADLLAPLELDEVVVLAPMASFAYDRPRTAFGRIERGVRRGTTKRLFREAAKLRATGTRVTLLGPGPEDLQAIGVNLMDARRRVRVFETALRTTATALRGHAVLGGGPSREIRLPDAAVPPPAPREVGPVPHERGPVPHGDGPVPVAG